MYIIAKQLEFLYNLPYKRTKYYNTFDTELNTRL